jgi:hypothetical protein
MKNVLTVALTVLLAATVQPGGVLNAAPSTTRVAAGTVKVTVTYKGKAGTVDGTHQLWVWLFDTPNIGPGAMPIAQVSLTKNGTDAVFDGVAGDKVYVAVAFDEKGVMAGDGPPPTGTPIGVLMGADMMPTGITPGDKGVATLNFDDTIRMP